jgi:hypothetical protein
MVKQTEISRTLHHRLVSLTLYAVLSVSLIAPIPVDAAHSAASKPNDSFPVPLETPISSTVARTSAKALRGINAAR